MTFGGSLITRQLQSLWIQVRVYEGFSWNDVIPVNIDTFRYLLFIYGHEGVR